MHPGVSLHLVQETETIGLREQKRRDTRRSIEDAATRLVDERGFKEVTVEEICEDAGISRRTFFNYFDSKDEAVLGSPIAAFSDDEREQIIHTPTDNVIKLIVNVMRDRFTDQDPRQEIWQRRQRIATDPNAAAELMARRRANSSETVELIAEHFRLHPQDRKLTEISLEMEAAITASFLRESLWLAMSCKKPDEGFSDSFRNAAKQLTTFSKGLTW